MNKRLLGVAMAAALMMAGAAEAAPAAAPIRTADLLQIQDLMARYEWALDFGDTKGYAALFGDDGVLVAGKSEAKGQTAILKWLGELSARFRASRAGAPPTKIIHILSNLVVDFKGADSADAKSFWTEVWRPDGKTMGVRESGHYEDKLVKRGGKWWFARRQIVNDFPDATPAP